MGQHFVGAKTIDSTGRVTIPKSLRDKFGLEEGDTVAIFQDEQVISLIPTPGIDPEDIKNPSRIEELEERVSKLDSGEFAPAE